MQVGVFSPVEHHALADLAEQYPGVHLDTTMAGTDFTERFAPIPVDYYLRLPGLRDKIVLGAEFPEHPLSLRRPDPGDRRDGPRADLGEAWFRTALWHNGARLLSLRIRQAMQLRVSA